MTTETKYLAQTGYSILSPTTSIDDVRRMVLRAVENRIGCIRVVGVYTSHVAKMLPPQRSLSIATVIGYPHGTSKPTIKAIEATAAIKDGADEVDLVPHLLNYLAGNVAGARDELLEIVRASRACRRDVKINVILDLGFMLKRPEPERLIECACQAVREGACDGIVIPGDSAEAIARVKSHAHELTIKATLAAERLELADAAFSAGADRVLIDF